MQKLSDNVYVETQLRGANHGFVVTREGVLMIDTPQYPVDAIKWRDEIKKHGPVRYIIITEPHGDHYSGTYFFEGDIIAHEGTKTAILQRPAEQFIKTLRERGEDGLSLIPNDFYFRSPTITFSEELTLYLGNHTFKLVNLPGHTPYEVAVHIPEERVAFTSDNIFHKVQTFLQAALPYEWLDSLKRIEELDTDVLVPGHGTICDKSYIAEQTAIIQSWIEGIKAAITSGVTVEDAQRNPPYVDPYPLEHGVERLADSLPRINTARLYEVLGNKR